MVEPRGVEPLSENLSTRLSTSVAYVLIFPPSGSRKQDPGFSSFIKSRPRQSLRGLVPHINDARIRRRGHRRADGHCLSSNGCEVYFVVWFLNFPLLSKRGASARLSGLHDPRRNHLRPHERRSAVNTIIHESARLVHIPHLAVHVALGVALGDRVALVVKLFALCDGKLELDLAVL